MPSKREILEALSKSELLDALDAHELAVDDRRRKERIIDALARARSVKVEDVLVVLPRDRLKELCNGFALDESGRAKADLIERLLNGASAPAAKTNGATAPRAAYLELAPGEKLTIDRLERYLWSAADILRGSIDSSDYKGFIFGFLFLKRLSDRFSATSGPRT